MVALPNFFLLMSAVFSTVTAFNISKTISEIKTSVENEVAAAITPIESSIIISLSSRCDLIKSILGLDYDAMDYEDEPDLSKLTLELKNGDNPIIFNIGNASTEIVKYYNYSSEDKLFIFVHGFTDNPTKENFQTFSEAFNQIGNNILALDGSSLIGWLYVRSTTYVRFIGEKLGEVLAALVNDGLNPDKIHIIGHSLGAHIAGFAGKTFVEQIGQQIGRISGLDPAGPCFINTNDTLRLNATDAAFVDVIHTDSGVFGLSEACGDVDFYPNGGSTQPKCVIPGSSHSRVVALYAESITDSTAFSAVKCESWDDFKEGKCEDEIRWRSPNLLLLIITALVPVTADGILGALGVVESGVKKELGAVTQPVESVLIGTLTNQCDLIKGFLGVQYKQLIADNDEPDLSNLTLEFRRGGKRFTFKLMNASAEILACSSYNSDSDFKLFLHGFTDDPTKARFTSFNEAFEKIGDYNVMALDSSSLIGLLYLRSSTYIRFIGDRLGQVLAVLVNNGLDPNKIHLVGHSLGAHIANFAGQTLTKLTGQILGRLTGLDPAGPCFMDNNSNLRLNPSSAAFVDVIHTDTGVFGLPEACGHVDFYPNGGIKQPNCVIIGCNHFRSVYLFVDSITDSAAFPARKCQSWNQFKKGQCADDISFMGLSCNSTTRGQFYLQTDGTEPFSIGYEGTAYTDNEALVTKVLSIV